MKEIFDWFELIHQASGRNEKQALIEKLIAIPELQPTLAEILRYTYDPYITFGVKLKEPKPGTTTSFEEVLPDSALLSHWQHTKTTLDQLANRELTGSAAKRRIDMLLSPLSIYHKRWWTRIINRNLRISGVAANTWANYFDGLVTNINPQLCDKFDNRTIDRPMFVEPKYDGIRAVFVPMEDGSVKAFSREGKPLCNTEALCALIEKSPDGRKRDRRLRSVLDGELFYRDFHSTQSITSTQTEHPDAGKLQFFVFDAIPYEEWTEKLSNTPLFRRKQDLRSLVDEINGFERKPPPTPEELKQRILEARAKIENERDEEVIGIEIAPLNEDPLDDPSWPVQFVPMKLIGTNAAAEKFYRQCIAAKFEGIILKEHDAPYSFKRDKTWMKMKPAHDTDITIVDAIEGNNRLVGSLGALIVQGTVMYNSRPYKVRGEVGSGFTDVDRAKLWQDHLEGNLKGRIVEVRYQEPDIDGALRFPVFVRMRDDRAEASQ